MYNNTISDEGVEFIADGLKFNSTLEKLHLSSNFISDRGIEKLFEAIESNSGIKDIDLASNNISCIGAKIIAKSLERNKTIESINIGANNIKDDGALAIAKALKNNDTLREIYIHNNPISYSFAEEIIKTLETNTTLTCIAFNGSQISQHLQSQINSLIQRNQRIAAEQKDEKLKKDAQTTSELIQSSTTGNQTILAQDLLAIQTQIQQQQQSINSVNQQISALQNPQSPHSSGSNSQATLIDEKYKITEQDLAERNYIAQNPKLKIYCETLQQNLNQAFLVSSIIGSGKVALNDGKISSVLKSLEGLSSGIPIGAAIFSAVSNAFGKLAKVRRAGRYSNFEELVASGDAVEKAAFCERLARLITIANEHNINDISNLGKTSLINELNGFFREQVSKIDNSFARGLFEETKSPEEMLAHKSSKTAIEFVLSGELSQEVERLNNIPAKQSSATTLVEIKEQEKNRIIDLVVEKTTGLQPKRLQLPTTQISQKKSVTPPPAPISEIPQDLDFEEMKRMMQDFRSMKRELESLKQENQSLKKEVSALKDTSSNDPEIDLNISSGNQMLAQKKSVTQSAKSKKETTGNDLERENLSKRVAHLESAIPEISQQAALNSEYIQSIQNEQQRPSSITKTKESKPLQTTTQNKDCCVIS
ncbi:MAG: hypothetical protein FJ368_06305 [Pelagibacterales bacterium]|nr:hypothetical protein [Pelagibacterales bacterium]